MLTAATVVALPWYLRNMVVVGSPTFNCNVRPAFESVVDALLFPDAAFGLVLSGLEEFITGLWWLNWLLRDWSPLLSSWVSISEAPGFGWVPLLAEVVQFAILLIGVAGAWQIVRRRSEDEHPAGGAAAFLALMATGLLAMLIIGLIRQTLFIDLHVARWTPRYAPVALPSIGILLGLSWCHFVPGRAWQSGAAVALGAAVVLQVLAAAEFIAFYQ